MSKGVLQIDLIISGETFSYAAIISTIGIFIGMIANSNYKIQSWIDEWVFLYIISFFAFAVLLTVEK